MSKRICLALGFALLTVMASPSRGHEPKSPPAQLALGHAAIYLIADAVVGNGCPFVATAFVGVNRPDTLPGPIGGGSGANNAGAGNVTVGTGGPGVPGEVPPEFVNTKPLAKFPDGTSVLYRPAGQASWKTDGNTATIEVNNEAIRNVNRGDHAKFKFPKK